MAKNVVGPVWSFDAVDQSEGWANRAEATAPVFQTKPWVEWILIESGATGGTYEVRESDDGRSLTGTIVLGANAEEQIAIGGYVQGIYIEAFGSDGQVLVKHGMS